MCKRCWYLKQMHSVGNFLLQWEAELLCCQTVRALVPLEPPVTSLNYQHTVLRKRKTSRFYHRSILLGVPDQVEESLLQTWCRSWTSQSTRTLAVVTDMHHHIELSFVDEFRWVLPLHHSKNGWQNAVLIWCMLQAGPPSLHYYCAVVLHSCIVLPPVGHSSNHDYHCCQLTRQWSCA